MKRSSQEFIFIKSNKIDFKRLQQNTLIISFRKLLNRTTSKKKGSKTKSMQHKEG